MEKFFEKDDDFQSFVKATKLTYDKNPGLQNMEPKPIDAFKKPIQHHPFVKLGKMFKVLATEKNPIAYM